METLFKDWRARCSGLGTILTNRPIINKGLLSDIEALEKEKKTGLNVNGNKVKWTDTKQEKLKGLIAKRDAPDELTQGHKTYLKTVFNDVFYRRKRVVVNKYVRKGTFNEQDSFDLLTRVDGNTFFSKNIERFSNDYIEGEPDIVYPWLIDIKSNWDKDTFDNAEVTDHYLWQVKGYIWLMLSNKVLTTYKGELVYCLVNCRPSDLQNEKTSIYYRLGCPSDMDQNYIEILQQIERNMIFDIEAWKNLEETNEITGEVVKVNENYQWLNDSLDFDMPGAVRVKRFWITLNTRDIAFIKSRVKLARKYLMELEEEEYRKMGL